MIKKDFVERFAEITGENKKRSKDLVEAFLDLSGDALKEEKKLRFVGWGGFEVKETPARKVKHPKTGEDVMIEAKNVVKFKPGQNLKKRIDESLKPETKKSSTKRIFKKLSSMFTVK